jgi:glycosyltransferase involved in cell wall biosynthesis
MVCCNPANFSDTAELVHKAQVAVPARTPKRHVEGPGRLSSPSLGTHAFLIIMKILFLSRWFPFPADNGSKIRIHNLLKGLSTHHEVTLLSFYDPGEASLEEIKRYPYCTQLKVVPWKPFDATSRKAKIGLFSPSPRSLLDTHSSQMESLIREVLSNEKFDVIIASQLTMASYYPAFGGLPAIFEEIELGLYADQALQSGNWFEQFRRRLTWFKLERYFLRLLNSFVLCTVVSDREREIVIRNFPQHAKKIEVLPNCVNVDDYQATAKTLKGSRLIFSGSFRYRPNYHAMQWFIRNAFPLILEKFPEVQLVITGDHANLPLPQTKNITLAGYVDDIKSLIASCNVSIAPLWSGGGTRLKILEAMALGTPVVATSKGAEGLQIEHGENILIADRPEKFAQSVIKILSDTEFRDFIASNALQLVKNHYDWRAMMPTFLGFLERATAV